MARKTVEVTIPGAEGSDNRDGGKTFVITEMAARPAQAWAYRAFGAMVHGGVDIPPDIIAAGMAGLAMVGLKSFLAAPYAEVEPLIDELMTCVQVKTEVQAGDGSGALLRKLIDRGEEGDDIEEISTRTRIQDEVLKLHTGFSVADALLTGVSAINHLLFKGLSTIQTPED